MIVHAPASLAYKCLPAERTARLIEQLVKDGERVVLTGAPAKSDLRKSTRITRFSKEDAKDSGFEAAR